MDITLLIEQYLSDKKFLRDMENDDIAIENNQIVRWGFKNIPCPTAEELEAYHLIVTQHNARQLILNEINNLEQEITPRRIREALLNNDNSFIQDIENKIIELRKHLQD